MVARKSSRVNRKYKTRYRIQNWPEYERGLRSRGDVTMWFSDEAVAAWVIQQLREAFPFDTAPRHLIFDRDSIFSSALVGFVKSMATKPCRTAYRSPWQNPVAERWIGGCRRELFDHVVVFSERHAVRLARAYIAYFHEDRTHLGLSKDTPSRRPLTLPPSSTAKVVAMPRVGGLHHRYEWREAA